MNVIHFESRERTTVNAKVLSFISNVISGWIEAEGENQDVILRNLNSKEFWAFTTFCKSYEDPSVPENWIRASSRVTDCYSPSVFVSNMQHLVKPFHMYDCSASMQRLYQTLAENPCIDTIRELDSLQNVLAKEWMTSSVAYYIINLKKNFEMDDMKWSNDALAEMMRILNDNTLFDTGHKGISVWKTLGDLTFKKK